MRRPKVRVTERRCFYCDGKGHVNSRDSMSEQVERRTLELCAKAVGGSLASSNRRLLWSTLVLPGDDMSPHVWSRCSSESRAISSETGWEPTDMHFDTGASASWRYKVRYRFG